MRKRLKWAVLSLVMVVAFCAAAFAGCTEKQENKPYFEKETVFHVDLSMSTAIGPLGTLCEPGTLTFRPDGTSSMDIPFTDAAIVMMDTILGYRIETFKHEDTYELNEDKTEITYHSSRESLSAEPIILAIETLSDGSMKFEFDIGNAIPDTVLYFYSNEDMMPEYDPDGGSEEPEPEPEPEPETFDVSFSAGEGVIFEEGFALPETQSYEEATEITLPEAKFSKEDNVFRGWAANGMPYEEGGKFIYQPGETVTIDRNVNFVAVWSDTLTVTFVKGDDGKTSSTTGNMVFYVEYNSFFYLPANSYAYKDYSKGFAGWTDGATTKQPGDSYRVTSDVTFEPVWAEYVAITFKANEADEDGVVIEAPLGSDVTLPNASFLQDDKGFAGWLEVGGSSLAKKPGAVVTAKEGLTFVAKYADRVTITFDKNGEDVQGKVPAALTVGNGLYFVFPECTLTREGYVFNGWGTSATSSSGSQPGQRTSTTKDRTYYAVWMAERTVSFDTGIADKTIDSLKQGEKMKITLPEMPYENGDKLFDGWTDGNKIYAAGASYTVPAGGDTELKAAWRDLITVKFAGGEAATGTVEDIEAYETKTITFPANNYVMSGKIFGGWSDGTNTYMPGDTYTVAEQEGSELTFTAVWNEGTPYADYTVTFRAGQTSEEVYVDADGASVTLNNFFPSGSMTELVLRPDLTADFVVKSTLAEKDFTAHNTAGSLGLTLEQFQENFTYDKQNISYDYDAESNTVTLNLGGGETLQLKLTKAAKNDKIGYDNVQFELPLKHKIGKVEKLTFAAIDGEPHYLAEETVFTGKIPDSVSMVGGATATLTIKPDGTGTLKVSFFGLNFTHMFTSDYKTVIWMGDEGDRLEGIVGETAEGKMTITVSLMGGSITMTEE